MNYIDITKQYKIKKKYQIRKQKYFISNNEERYNVDGKNVILKPTKQEIEVAKILGEIFGGKIRIIPKVNVPEGIKTPDYIIKNDKFDLKGIKGNGKNTIDSAIKKQEKQANNFIFDISDSKMNKKEAIYQIKRIYNSKHREWIRKIILIKHNKIIKIYERK